MRREYREKNPEIALGPVTLNTAARTVCREAERVNLTPAEYCILERLALSHGRVLSKDQLIEALHDSESSARPNVIEGLVCTLRKKIGDSIVETRRGHGYCIA